MGVPQIARWFIVENPIKMHELGAYTPMLRNHRIDPNFNVFHHAATTYIYVSSLEESPFQSISHPHPSTSPQALSPWSSHFPAVQRCPRDGTTGKASPNRRCCWCKKPCTAGRSQNIMMDSREFIHGTPRGRGIGLQESGLTQNQGPV